MRCRVSRHHDFGLSREAKNRMHPPLLAGQRGRPDCESKLQSGVVAIPVTHYFVAMPPATFLRVIVQVQRD
jgi:hypothetical protein